MKPSFKNHYPEGRYRSFEHICADIKIDGKQVGVIQYSESSSAIMHKRNGDWIDFSFPFKLPVDVVSDEDIKEYDFNLVCKIMDFISSIDGYCVESEKNQVIHRPTASIAGVTPEH